MKRAPLTPAAALFLVLWLSCAFAPTPSYAQDQTEQNKNTAEALRQEVSTALAARPPLKADLTWRSKYASDPAPSLDALTGDSTTPPSPTVHNDKRSLVVIFGSTGIDQFVSTKGKSYPEHSSEFLSHFGDPFIPYFRTSFPSFTNEKIYVTGLRYVGTESKNGVVYRILEADLVIVDAPTVSVKPIASQIHVPKALFSVTNWRWYVGPDHLIQRFTWKSHINPGANQAGEQNEVTVNRYFFSN